jgi:Rho termination factor, N-terminal domain.
MADEETYADWTVEELRAEASERALEGRSGLNKDELVALLEADDLADEEVTVEEVEEAEAEEVVAYLPAELADEGPLVHRSSGDVQRFLDEDGNPKEEAS